MNLIKAAIILVFLTCYHSPQKYKESDSSIQDSIIQWQSNKRLSFEDFRDIYGWSKNYSESGGTSYRLKISHEVTQHKITITIIAIFNKNMSFLQIRDS